MHIYCTCTKKAKTAMLVTICSAVLVLAAAVFAFAHESHWIFKNSADKGKTVIIDPGHGEPDGGAVGIDGIFEEKINLSISLKLKNFFSASGYTVIMTRVDDNAIYDKGSATIRQKKNIRPA